MRKLSTNISIAVAVLAASILLRQWMTTTTTTTTTTAVVPSAQTIDENKEPIASQKTDNINNCVGGVGDGADETCVITNSDDDDDDDNSIDDDKDDDDERDNDCFDEDELCSFWAAEGECEGNPDYMFDNCRRSCGRCRTDNDGLDVGVEQQVYDHDHGPETAAIISQSTTYLKTIILPDIQYSPILDLCRNDDELCAYWAAIGECTNPETKSFMRESCSLACRVCERHLLHVRCPMDEDAKPALEQPGGMNVMFENIITSGAFEKYGIEVHSRPYRRMGDEDEREEDLGYKIGPWIVTLDNFMSDEECDAYVRLGDEEDFSFSRSSNVGDMKADGSAEYDIDDSRTSENAWCGDKCDEDPLAFAVINRMSEVTGIPTANQEYIQILRYKPGQYYEKHHDYIEYQVERPTGPRILTFFLYLSDVEEGGETKFNDLDILVSPKKGRALLWPSVRDENLTAIEDNTYHEAMPVKKGIKFGANAWIHLYDYKIAHDNDCA